MKKRATVVLINGILLILLLIALITTVILYLLDKLDKGISKRVTKLKWAKARLKYEVYEQSGGTPRNTQFPG